MTPQEKASSLCKKFNLISHKDKWETTSYTLLSLDSAKELALKAVDEIIESRKDDSRFGDTLLSTSSEYYNPHPMYITYWLQVKQEIEKL